MRPIRIDFIEPQAWKFIWITAVVVILIICFVYGTVFFEVVRKRGMLDQRLSLIRNQEQQSHTSSAAVSVNRENPRAGNEAVAARLIQHDWNILYDAIETPALKKMKLVQMSVGAQSGQITLQFELENMDQAVRVTDALNQASRSNLVWRLERLDSTAVNGVVSGAFLSVKGLWVADGK